MKKFDIKKLITLRQWLHKHPELSLKEFNTQTKIKEELVKLGIKESEIVVKAKTGLQVDLKGTGSPSEKSKIICLRADIDALPIKEKNDLISKSFESKFKIM